MLFCRYLIVYKAHNVEQHLFMHALFTYGTIERANDEQVVVESKYALEQNLFNICLTEIKLHFTNFPNFRRDKLYEKSSRMHACLFMVD